MFRQIYQPISAQVKDENGEYRELYYLGNERGYIYSKEEVLQLFEQIKDFYESEDLIKQVHDYNQKIKLEECIFYMSSPPTKNENGKYKIPSVNYKYKVFKTDKKHWSIKCGWCGVKVSSKTEEGYYSIHNSNFNIYTERACSENCSKLIWKEGIKNWISENGYQKFFDC